MDTVPPKDYGTHSKNSKNSKTSIRKPQIFIFEKIENRILYPITLTLPSKTDLAVYAPSRLYKPLPPKPSHLLMSSLGKSTKDLKFSPYKPPQQKWFPTNAALQAALTRIENALDTLERLADAIESHLGMR